MFGSKRHAGVMTVTLDGTETAEALTNHFFTACRKYPFCDQFSSFIAATLQSTQAQRTSTDFIGGSITKTNAENKWASNSFGWLDISPEPFLLSFIGYIRIYGFLVFLYKNWQTLVRRIYEFFRPNLCLPMNNNILGRILNTNIGSGHMCVPVRGAPQYFIATIRLISNQQLIETDIL